MFDYHAAALAYRQNEGRNPVRPLAVQAVPVTPMGTIVAEGGFGFTYSMEKFQERLAELDSRKGDETLREEVASGEATGYTEAELLAQIAPQRYAGAEGNFNPHGH